MKNKKTPFFILGNPRSGTTLLRLLLNSHSSLCVPPESGFMIWLFGEFGNWCKVDNHSFRISEFISKLKIAKKIEHWDIDFDKLLDRVQKNQPNDYGELVSLVYQSYSVNHGKLVRLWGDKNNYYLNHIEDLLQIFPGANLIHIIRDGRDVASSYLALNYSKGSVEYTPVLEKDIISIARAWVSNNSKILEDGSKLAGKKMISIRYEDLVLNPQAILREICGFLGVDYESGMLYYHQNKQFYEPVSMFWKAETKKPIHSFKIGRYKSDLSFNDIQSFQKVACNMLERFGYECQ